MNSFLISFDTLYTHYRKELDEDLKKAKSIKDIEERYQKAEIFFKKHERIEGELRINYSNGKLQDKHGYPTKYHEYKEKVCQLKKIRDEVKKNVKLPKQNIDNFSHQPVSNNENNWEEYISCQQCFKEIKTGKNYWYHKTKNDSYKFCSTECYKDYYGEYCSKCVNENKNFTKYLNVIPDGDDTYCRACYELVKKEQKEREEQETRYCKYCSTKLVKEGNLKYSLRICDKDDCLLKLDKELYPNKHLQSSYNKSDANNNSSNLSIEREREREREQNLTQQAQLRMAITQLESNPNEQTLLVSKKQQLAELESKEKELTKSLPIDVQISILQREIKSLETKPSRTKTEEKTLESKKKKLTELSKKQSNSNTNTAKPSDKSDLYIGLGIIGILLPLTLFILVRKYKKRPVKA